MPPRDDWARIRDMLSFAEDLLGFAQGKSYQDLLADKGLQYICVHCLELLGEAASSVSAEFRESHSEVPWRAIIAMRNRLIHGYFTIELPFVWNTVAEDIPPLLLSLQSLLAEEQGR